MLGKVFKAYDIRGTVPDPLNDKMAKQIGYGCARFLIEDAAAAGERSPMMRNIVVGRDMRKSSPSLTNALHAGINAFGADVLDVGLVDTPFIYFAINHLDCAGGVMTTASHNPPNYNGFKVAGRKAKPVGEETGLAEVRKWAAMVEAVPVKDRGRVEKRDLWEPYIEHVRSFLSTGGRRIKVVVDASNGMAGTMVPKVFGPGGEAIKGLHIVEMNFENSKGEFVHEPNPLVAANLEALQIRVVEEEADLGICFDGDADRCVVIDEKGRIVGCDHLTAVLAAYFLEHEKGAIVYDLRSTRALPEEIIKHGGKPIRSKVGHVNMKAIMAQHRCVFGGELSGHFYFRKNFNADSGAIAMAVILSVVAKSQKKMSDLIKPMRRYRQSGEINFTTEDKDGALETLRTTFKDIGVDELDGVTIDQFEEDGWWCNVRKSNTEPLLRLNLEAKTQPVLDTMLGVISPLLGRRVEH